MSVIKQLKRLKYCDFMIRRCCTGNLKQFAEKNRLSKTGLCNFLKEMKELGFLIKYSRSKTSYCYYKRGKMVDDLFINIDEIKLLDKEQASKPLFEADKKLCFSELTVIEIC